MKTLVFEKIAELKHVIPSKFCLIWGKRARTSGPVPKMPHFCIARKVSYDWARITNKKEKIKMGQYNQLSLRQSVNTNLDNCCTLFSGLNLEL